MRADAAGRGRARGGRQGARDSGPGRRVGGRVLCRANGLGGRQQGARDCGPVRRVGGREVGQPQGPGESGCRRTGLLHRAVRAARRRPRRPPPALRATHPFRACCEALLEWAARRVSRPVSIPTETAVRCAESWQAAPGTRHASGRGGPDCRRDLRACRSTRWTCDLYQAGGESRPKVCRALESWARGAGWRCESAAGLPGERCATEVTPLRVGGAGKGRRGPTVSRNSTHLPHPNHTTKPGSTPP